MKSINKLSFGRKLWKSCKLYDRDSSQMKASSQLSRSEIKRLHEYKFAYGIMQFSIAVVERSYQQHYNVFSADTEID